ncbi:hypothetical protein [Aliikangiella sp. G2MR2-5]|uniref:hypothetical protein n=1 Tax=Aliikangiella sp. G2MR2-5 TaxID=2788943 RepID=UPI001AEE8C8F|nr:hypothetical protein [Aliikangiella sp. G2MR2-5]
MMNYSILKCCAKLVSGTALAISAFSAQADYLYDFPFKGQNFSDYEKLYTFKHADSTSQKHGFDISGKRFNFGTGKWTSLKGNVDEDKNENRVIYEKSIYAMRSGTVVGCWRSAPENPRVKNGSDYLKDEQGEYILDDEGNKISSPERLWIHPRLRDVANRTIPKAGNHLLIKHADNSYALYAHMVPGSIPYKFCPRTESNYDELGLSSIPGSDYPDITGISPTRSYTLTVNKGDKIGEVGNSGNSTGPHLHVHVAEGEVGGNTGIPIKFRRGIAAKYESSKKHPSWVSFAGKEVKTSWSGTDSTATLIWPARSLGSQYVRHGFNSDGYSGLFKHLVDSGFKIDWFDGFTVGNTTRYNMIWKPVNIGWRHYSRKTSSGYQSVFNKAVDDGYVPTHVESYNTPYGVRYSAIFEKKSTGFLARHNISYNEHMNTYNQAKNLGMSPTSISVVSVNGERRYTVLYQKRNIGSWSIRSQMTSSQYNTTFADMKANNKFPVYLNSYVHNGTVYYTAVFASKPESNYVGAKHGLTASGFQSYFNYYSGYGYLTKLITGIDGYNYTHYAGVWRK